MRELTSGCRVVQSAECTERERDRPGWERESRRCSQKGKLIGSIRIDCLSYRALQLIWMGKRTPDPTNRLDHRLLLAPNAKRWSRLSRYLHAVTGPRWCGRPVTARSSLYDAITGIEKRQDEPIIEGVL